MKRILLSFKTALAAAVICAAGISAVSAQTAEEFFLLGNNAYKKGDFARAKENYSEAAKLGDPSAELFFNLANTCAKLNLRGEAYLNFLRAIYENPRMREADANLIMFAKDNSLPLPPNVFLADFLSELSDSEWTAAALITFWLAAMSIVLPPLYGKKSAASIFLALVMFALFALSATGLHGWTAYKNLAVAITADVPLKAAPAAGAPASAMASEGQVARIEGRKNGYVYVETPTGKRGWADASKFVPVDI